MANETDDELLDLRSRVEALESLVLILRGRIENLEAAAGDVHPEFHMADEAPTV